MSEEYVIGSWRKPSAAGVKTTLKEALSAPVPEKYKESAKKPKAVAAPVVPALVPEAPKPQPVLRPCVLRDKYLAIVAQIEALTSRPYPGYYAMPEQPNENASDQEKARYEANAGTVIAGAMFQLEMIQRDKEK